MADTDVFGLLGPSDLQGFSQRVEASDPFGLIGRSLNSWQPDLSRMNATESGITSFGRAFLSGLATNYAQNRASEQLSKVVNLLPQLGSDPYSVATPEGVDGSAFNLLRGSAILNKTQADAAGAAQGKSDLRSLIMAIAPEAIKSGAASPEQILEAAKTGKFEGVLGAADPMKNPNSRQYQLSKDEQEKNFKLDQRVTDARDYLKLVGAPYQEARSNMDLMLKNIDVSNPAVDLMYAVAGNKIIDPSAIVRSDDVKNIQDIVPLLEKNIAGFKKYITPAGTISREGKLAILKAVSPKMDALGENYQKLLSVEKDRLGSLKANPDSLAAYEYRPYDLNSLMTSTGGGGDTSAIDAALARKGFGPDGRPLGAAPYDPLKGY